MSLPLLGVLNDEERFAPDFDYAALSSVFESSLKYLVRNSMKIIKNQLCTPKFYFSGRKIERCMGYSIVYDKY